MSIKIVLVCIFGFLINIVGKPEVKVAKLTPQKKTLTFSIDSKEYDTSNKIFSKLTDCLSDFEFIISGNYDSLNKELELIVDAAYENTDYLKCVSIFNDEINSISQFVD